MAGLVDSEEVLKAVAKRLDDDATLMALVHAVQYGGRRDEGRGRHTNPYVTVTDGVVLAGDHLPLELHTIQLTISADNVAGSKLPDEAKLGDVKSRVHTLLDDHRPTVTGAKAAGGMLCRLATGALFDPEEPREHYCAMRWELTLLPS